MVMDEKMTALIFPPLYTFNKIKKCEDRICGLKSLILMDHSILNKPHQIPNDLAGSQIISSRIDRLSSRQVVSYTVLENSQERVYVYFLDDNKFVPIINSATSMRMITKYGRGGGQIAIGGSDDDFLIMYDGYEILAARYLKGNLSDVSRFFGLRISDGRFLPYIIKQGEGANSLWYVLSLNSGKPRLIKLWQNNSNEIAGAHDFSYIFNDLSDSLLAFWSGNNRGELDFIFESGDAGDYLKTFVDNGFDNSIDRVVQSANINSRSNRVLKAKIQSLGLAGEANIFLSDSEYNFIKTKVGQEIKFNGSSSSLFWKIIFFKSSDNEYSPWLEHIKYLDYYLTAE